MTISGIFCNLCQNSISPKLWKNPLGKVWICPQWTQRANWGWIQTLLRGFFHNLILVMHEPLIKASFIICSEMCSQFAQPHTQWVLWELIVKQSTLRVSFEIIKKSPLGTCLSTFWANCERSLDEWLRHHQNQIVKEPSEQSLNSPLHLPAGFNEDKFKLYPGGSFISCAICYFGTNCERTPWFCFGQSAERIEITFKLCSLG